MNHTDKSRRSSVAVPGRVDPATLLLLLALAVGVMILLTAVEGALFRLQRGDEIDWPGLVSGRALAWLTCAAFIPPLYLLTIWAPIGRAAWKVAVPVHLAASVAATTGKYALYLPLTHLLDGGTDRPWLDSFRAGFLGELMFYWAIIGLAHAVFFYTRAASPDGGGPGRRHGRPAEPGDGSIRLSLAVGAATEVIDTDLIRWISAEGNYVKIHLDNRQILVRHTLAALEARLPRGFARVHRSAIVNVTKVRRMEPLGQGTWRIILSGDGAIVSGRAYKARVRALLE